jgi:TolB protein
MMLNFKMVTILKEMKMKIRMFVSIVLLCGALAACATPAATPQPEAESQALANPASENCIAQGGTLSIEERGDGGQYGVCYFENNQQCEEWALLNGACPVGGIPVTAYITHAARYCAITGGTYTATDGTGTPDEQGTCTFTGGAVCDAGQYFNGACSPDQPATQDADASAPNKANPASENCVSQGGTLEFAQDGAGNTYGICYFEDNRQCEEWALLRGECPLGGLKVTGYVTPAATYCVITGGTYAITVAGDENSEQGTCTFPDGSACDAWEYWYGTCSRGAAAAPIPTPNMGGGSGWLVFDSTRDNPARDLYVIDLTSSAVTRLTQGEAGSFAGPFSPDGLSIAYTTYGLTNSAIAVINADGSGQTVIDTVDGSDEGFPAWSPDGTRLAFTSRRDGNNEIYLMNADGSGPVRLTDAPGDDFAPAWSPDGSQLVFASDRDNDPGVYDLYFMNADGSNVRRLTDDPYIDYSPAWSPDGQWIAFRSHHDGAAADIYIINIDGSGMLNLTNDPADDWAPAWSPDGSLIAFQTNREGNWEIYRMTPAGGQLANLSLNPADDQLPHWQP